MFPNVGARTILLGGAMEVTGSIRGHLHYEKVGGDGCFNANFSIPNFFWSIAFTSRIRIYLVKNMYQNSELRNSVKITKYLFIVIMK